METLLSLTSKQAGDWFKEDLRTFGGLDHIIDTGELMRVAVYQAAWNDGENFVHKNIFAICLDKIVCLCNYLKWDDSYLGR